MNSRFQTIDHFIEYMSKIEESEEKDEFDLEDFIKKISSTILNRNGKKLRGLKEKFDKVFAGVVGLIQKKFDNIEVGGPSVLPHWEPMCIAGHAI